MEDAQSPDLGRTELAERRAQAAGAEIFATASPGKWEHLRSQGVVHIMEIDNDSEFPIVGVVMGGWEQIVTACQVCGSTTY
jgi:hypothetical protein